jgi:tetratricopeptide (TPR) repeat protein
LNLAIVQRQTERLDEALLNVRRALAIDARSVHGLHQLVLVHLAEARNDPPALELAALACRQALIVDESFAPLHNTCGIVDVEGGRVVEALARFERAFGIDPRLYEAWMNFGQITLSFRGYEDAERAFRGALEAQPSDYDARIGLGVALRGLRRFAEARAQWEAARTIAPERPEAWYDLGLLHQEHLGGQLPDLTRAELFFETFVRKASDDPSFTEAIDEVTRCCPVERSARTRRECRPGRLQNVRSAIDAISRAESPRGC